MTNSTRLFHEPPHSTIQDCGINAQLTLRNCVNAVKTRACSRPSTYRATMHTVLTQSSALILYLTRYDCVDAITMLILHPTPRSCVNASFNTMETCWFPHNSPRCVVRLTLRWLLRNSTRCMMILEEERSGKKRDSAARRYGKG